VEPGPRLPGDIPFAARSESKIERRRSKGMASQPQISARPIDQDKLKALLGQAVQDMGASLHAALIVIGDKLGPRRRGDIFAVARTGFRACA
jgi:hypothetical protein